MDSEKEKSKNDDRLETKKIEVVSIDSDDEDEEGDNLKPDDNPEKDSDSAKSALEDDSKKEEADKKLDDDAEKHDDKSAIQAVKPFKKYSFGNPKFRLIVLSIFLGLIVILFAVGCYFLFFKKTDQKAEDVIKDDSKIEQSIPTLVESPLDGLMADKAAAERHPLAVVIENHVDARPQSGLDKASVVYEAIAEGGITRFLAIFGTFEAEKAGPVRSARTFFVDWAEGYSAYLAHVGGNMDALDQIKADRIYDLDQFAFTKPYWREYAINLATEHTMYTDTSKLREQAAANGYPTANNFTVYKFKDDPTDKTLLPAAQTVAVNFSNPSYAVKFIYNKENNSYQRFLAGKEHVDKVTKNQIAPKNIVVMTVKRQSVLTRINEPGYRFTTLGTGAAKIFMDGQTINGTWKKNSKTEREIFYDDAGQEITFDRGQLWICVIPPEATVTVQ